MLFRRKPPPGPSSDPDETYRRVLERLAEVQVAQKKLEVEWELVFEKVKAALARLSKRDERARAAESLQDAPGSTIAPQLDPRGEGETDDRWVRLARAKKARREA